MASIVYSSRNKPISALLVTTAIIVTRTTFISSSTVSGGHTVGALRHGYYIEFAPIGT